MKLNLKDKEKVFSELMSINEQVKILNDRHQKIRLAAQIRWGINFNEFNHKFIEWE